MSEEINSILQEINEEIKNDQLLVFIKKYRNAIVSFVVVTVIGILAYSSWHLRKVRKMEGITNALLNIIQKPSSSSNLIVEELAKDAPFELKPILEIIKSGRNLFDFKEIPASSEALLELTKKGGVDVVWKDLAIIIYTSYRFKPAEELIKLLEPLTADNRPFRFMAIEFIAMNYEELGKHDKASEYLQKISSNTEAPKTQKKRVAILANYINERKQK
ncbi:MAG: hypothetical protein LBF57_01300 [Holosporaceae bacterium]|jgi:hypothetical protein|nr:hypothetical protein [Holosporaceae bacterium]